MARRIPYSSEYDYSDEDELIEKIVQKLPPILEIKNNHFPANLNGIVPINMFSEERQIQYIEKLKLFLETGEESEEFKQIFEKELELEFECGGGGTFLRIEILSENEFDKLSLTKESVYNRTNWKIYCPYSYYPDLDREISNFDYSTWRWGKVRFIMSGFVDSIG